MASRLIHYLIAEEIAKANNKLDRDRFVYGAILPDLSLHEDGSYDKTHYGEKLMEDKRKGINWHNFRDKYHQSMHEDSLYLGYYCHLIMDALWVSKITNQYIRVHPYPERKEYYKKSYADYKILNYLLSTEYKIQYHIPLIELTDIDDINMGLRDSFFDGLKSDINESVKHVNLDLQLYPYDMIIDYINQAKELCMNEIEYFLNGKEFLNPSNLYISL